MDSIILNGILPIHFCADVDNERLKWVEIKENHAVVTNGNILVRFNLIESELNKITGDCYIHMKAWEILSKLSKKEGVFCSTEQRENVDCLKIIDDFGIITLIPIYSKEEFARLGYSFPDWRPTWEWALKAKAELPVDCFSVNPKMLDKMRKAMNTPDSISFYVTEASKAIKFVSGDELCDGVIMPVMIQTSIDFGK